MGVAAYNRGSMAIRRSIDAETAGRTFKIAFEPKPFFPSDPLGPKFSALGYWNLVDDPCMVEVGDRVYCTVSGCGGWDIVTEVKGTRNDLRIRTQMNCPRTWAYAHNFTRNPAVWMTK